MRLARAVLWLVLVTFAGFGFAFTFFPLRMAELVDITLPTDTARVDFVATYGGFELGFAAFLLWCAGTEARMRIGLVASGLGLSGFALARLGAVLVAADVKPVMYAVVAAESAGALASFWAARHAATPLLPTRPASRP